MCGAPTPKTITITHQVMEMPPHIAMFWHLSKFIATLSKMVSKLCAMYNGQVLPIKC